MWTWKSTTSNGRFHNRLTIEKHTRKTFVLWVGRIQRREKGKLCFFDWQFLLTQLGLSSIGENIERAQRVGKFDEGTNKPRPIVKFSSFRRRESVNKLDYSWEQNLKYKNNFQEKLTRPERNYSKLWMRFDVTARRDKLYTDGREHNPQPSDP